MPFLQWFGRNAAIDRPWLRRPSSHTQRTKYGTPRERDAWEHDGSCTDVRVFLHEDGTGAEAQELGWDRRAHQVSARIIVIDCVDSCPMGDIREVPHFEPRFRSNEHAGRNMRVATNRERPGRK